MAETFRRERAGDQSDISSIHRAAFPTIAEANLVEALRDGDHTEVSLVAEVDQQVVGHILFSRLTIHDPTGQRHPALSLGPMAVLPEHQRQGIGSKLVVAGLETCRVQGHQRVLVLGHSEFYPRFGFRPEPAERLTSPFGGGKAWMAMELVPGALGGVQGRVEYAPPFKVFE